MITTTVIIVGTAAGCVGGVFGGLIVLAFTSRTRPSDEPRDDLTVAQRRAIRDRPRP